MLEVLWNEWKYHSGNSQYGPSLIAVNNTTPPHYPVKSYCRLFELCTAAVTIMSPPQVTFWPGLKNESLHQFVELDINSNWGLHLLVSVSFEAAFAEKSKKKQTDYNCKKSQRSVYELTPLLIG